MSVAHGADESLHIGGERGRSRFCDDAGHVGELGGDRRRRVEKGGRADLVSKSVACVSKERGRGGGGQTIANHTRRVSSKG